MIQVVVQVAAFLAEKVLEAESGEKLTRAERAPYPPDGPVEILPPVDSKQDALKRKALDKEFWDNA